MLAIQLFAPSLDRAHLRAFHGIMRANARRDFRRDTVFTKRKTGWLIGPTAHRESARVYHPVERPIGTGLDNRRSPILEFRISILVRERHFGFRYMPVRIPRFDHVHPSQADLLKTSKQNVIES